MASNLLGTLRGRPGDGEFCSTLPVVLKCLTMFQTLVLGSRSLFAIAPVDSPCLCNVMIFWRNTKHFVIFEGTKILTWFSADRHSWVWPISCPSQKCGKIQITSYRTRNVAFQYIWSRVSQMCQKFESSLSAVRFPLLDLSCLYMTKIFKIFWYLEVDLWTFVFYYML